MADWKGKIGCQFICTYSYHKNIQYIHSKQCDQEKIAKIYKSYPKMISLEQMMDFDTYTKIA